MIAPATAVVRDFRTTDDRAVKDSLTVQHDAALADWLPTALGVATLADLEAKGIEPCVACNLPVRFGEASGPFHSAVCREEHHARLGRGAEREAARLRAIEKRGLRRLGLPVPAHLLPAPKEDDGV